MIDWIGGPQVCGAGEMTISCYVPERKLLNTLKFTTIGFPCFLRVVLCFFFVGSRWIFLPGFFFCVTQTHSTHPSLSVYIRNTRHTQSAQGSRDKQHSNSFFLFFASEPRRVLSIVFEGDFCILLLCTTLPAAQYSNAHGSLARCFLRRRRHNTDWLTDNDDCVGRHSSSTPRLHANLPTEPYNNGRQADSFLLSLSLCGYGGDTAAATAEWAHMAEGARRKTRTNPSIAATRLNLASSIERASTPKAANNHHVHVCSKRASERSKAGLVCYPSVPTVICDREVENFPELYTNWRVGETVETIMVDRRCSLRPKWSSQRAVRSFRSPLTLSLGLLEHIGDCLWERAMKENPENWSIHLSARVCFLNAVSSDSIVGFRSITIG